MARQFPTIHEGSRLVKAPIGFQGSPTDPFEVPEGEGYFYSADGSHYGAQGDLVYVSKDTSANLSHAVQNEPGFQAHLSTAASVDSFTQLVFDDVEFDDRGEYDPSTGVFTAASDGRYEVNIALTFRDHADGDVLAAAVKQNNSSVMNVPATAGGTGDTASPVHSKKLNLTEGDTLTFEAFEDGSGNEVKPANANTWVEVYQVR